LTDVDLLQRIRSGDVTALQVFYERYLPSVWRYVYALVHGNFHVAEDVTSETFLAAVRSIHQLDPAPSSVSGWLLGIARNKAADFFRKMNLQDQTLKTLHNGLASFPAESIDLLELGELRGEVLDILDRMEAEERLVLEWKYLDEISVREIGTRLGRSEKAIESVLFRARNSFRKLMKSNKRAKELRHASF
jgi:RNA polymerase sigma-70 factor (ECF subfamily)